MLVRISYDYDYSIYDYDYEEEYWRKVPVFQRQLKYVRVLVDICPYWIQIVLNLALAVERYILICRGTDAKTLLSQKRRRFFYGFVLVLIAVVPVFSVLYLSYLIHFQKRENVVS